jgi:two-component system response regulator AtoC
MSIQVCLIEDDEIMGESLVDRFELEGMRVEWYREARLAMQRIKQHAFNVVVSDIRLPDMGGDVLFKSLVKSTVDLPPFMFLTAYGTIERAVDLLQLGAVDYLCKPFDIDDLLSKIRRFQRPVNAPTPFDGLNRASSPAMVKLSSLIPKFAKSADTVLITGESGVGKEFFARLLHELDTKRSTQPFYAINCAAIPETLIESELFGHEKGAFTGAVKAKRGAFEQAGTGTLFLDEIGDLSLSAQVKLLRVLQERSARRVGGEALMSFSCRVIAATNRPLSDNVKSGIFREDLLYRLNALHLHVPSLRERPDEILPLARKFLDLCNRRSDEKPKLFSVNAEAALATYEWPGNVRELKNTVERAYLLAGSRTIERSHLFDNATDDGAEQQEIGSGLATYLVQHERAYLLEHLVKHQWRITETAGAIGISRKVLWEKMRRYDINAPSGHHQKPAGDR